jgi:hypothetical protein
VGKLLSQIEGLFTATQVPHLKIESHFNEIPFRRERQSLGTIIKCESEPGSRGALQIGVQNLEAV